MVSVERTGVGGADGVGGFETADAAPAQQSHQSTLDNQRNHGHFGDSIGGSLGTKLQSTNTVCLCPDILSL